VNDRNQVFLLSPAYCGGKRAQLLFNERGNFELARQLSSGQSAPLGEVFSFLSGLYFRGKLAYARAFARPPAGFSGTLVITPDRGLLPADELVTLTTLREFSRIDIKSNDSRYSEPLARDAREFALTIGANTDVVLLGSVASAKYVEVLSEILKDRLLFPEQFVGRGDMSRGGLMLRCVEDSQELRYIPVAGATQHGPRPPKLPKKGLRLVSPISDTR
jgi:hypothetical protein